MSTKTYAEIPASYLRDELYQRFREEDSLFEFLQAGSLDGIWYWDLEHPEHEWMSPEFWRLLGYDPREKQHLASEWMDLINADDLKTAQENLQKHLADPAHPYDQVVRYRHQDGSTVWVRCRGLAILDDAGKPVRMLGAHTDLTASKQLEAQLLEQQEDLQQKHLSLTAQQDAINEMMMFQDLVQETIPGLFFVKDRQFRIVQANTNFLSLYPEEMRSRVLGHTTLEDYSEADKEAFLAKDREAFKTGYSQALEQIHFPDGEVRTLDTHKTRFEDMNGTPFILGLAIDVTDREQLSRQVEDTNESFARFAARVSSDVMAPLQGIRQSISNLRQAHDALASHEVSRALESVEMRLGSLERLMDHVLGYAQLETQVTDPSLVSFADCAREALQRLVKPHNFVLSVADARVSLPREALQMILQNLMALTVRLSGGGTGEMTIEITQNPTGYVIKFRADAPGLSPLDDALMSGVTETTEARIDPESGAAALARTAQLLQLYGGTISVVSPEPGAQGVQWDIVWPRGESADLEPG